MNLETLQPLEKAGDLEKSLRELPASHLERVDVKALEELTKWEACEKIAGDYYDGLEKGAPGILNGFSEISGGKGKEAFQEAYSDYVTKPEQLREKEQPLYDFLRDRVFHGREYAVEVLNLEPKQEKIGFTGYNRRDIVASTPSADFSFRGSKLEDLQKKRKDAEEDLKRTSEKYTKAGEDIAKGWIGVKPYQSWQKAGMEDAKKRIKELDRQINREKSKD